MTPQLLKGDVLFITRFDASAIGGASFWSCACLQAFSMLYGDRLTVIARPEVKDVVLPKKMGGFVSVPPRSWFQKAWYLMTLKGMDRLSPFLDRWLEETDLSSSLVVFDSSRMGRFAPLFQSRGIPVVTIHQNVELDFVHSVKPIAVLRPLVRHVVENNERMAFKHSLLNLTLTQDDGRRLLELYGGSDNAVVKSLGGFERMHSPPLPRLSSASKAANELHIVSTGSLCDYQTQEGIGWFVSSILPALREILPNLHYTVAGRRPGAGLKRLVKMAGVQLIADPVDMGPILNGADIYLSPVRKGEGLKLRLMDALRAGLPVVSHSVSARGYAESFPTSFFATFGTEEECVHAVKRIVRLLPLDLSARQAIQERYANQFTFRVGVERLRCLLLEYLPERARPTMD